MVYCKAVLAPLVKKNNNISIFFFNNNISIFFFKKEGCHYPTFIWASTLESKKEGKIRNHYNQVPYLTPDTKWESDKIEENLTHKRAKRSALSH